MQFIDIYIIFYDGVRKRVCVCACVRLLVRVCVCFRLTFCAQRCLCLVSLSCPFFIAPSVFSNVYWKAVVEQDTIDIISLLDPNKAVGPDRISNKMLREVKYEFAGPLCLLFNKSLRDKIFPADWKLAHIILIFKSGDKSPVSNYRPVALFSLLP
jgi:hypothetical protein